MTSLTAKYQLVVSQSGDASDMPTYTASAMAAVEAALDRVLAQANTAAAGKVNRAGDTMTGTLNIAPAAGNAQLVLKSPGGGWVVEGSAAGGLYLGTASTGAGTAKAVLTATRNGEPTFPGTAHFLSAVHLEGAVFLRDDQIPTVNDGGGAIRCLYYMNDGRLRRADPTNFRFLIGAASAASSRRFKHDIADPDTIPDVQRLKPKAYVWNEDAELGKAGVRLGMIAEDAAAVDERFVSRDQEGQIQGLDHAALIAALVDTVQRLTERVETLEGGR